MLTIFSVAKRCSSKQKNMSHLLHDDIAILLRSPRLPGRLNSPQTAALLGFQPHDIPVLVAKKLLRPLGKPVPQAPKYFAAPEIEKLATNPAWLGKAAQAMCDHWKGKNESRKEFSLDPESVTTN
jgi:hypothetical protein